ncbi:MAG TPA: hypothetical protein VEF04_07285 [Blastocatellia bacterium]|nr:hypothetical protein [Blastocatellia bacterium]
MSKAQEPGEPVVELYRVTGTSLLALPERKPVLCDVCGRSLMTTDGKTTMTGIEVRIFESDKVALSEIYPELEPGRTYRVCMVDYLRSLGVRI